MAVGSTFRADRRLRQLIHRHRYRRRALVFALGCLAGALVNPLLGVACGLCLVVASPFAERRRRRHHEAAIARELPEVIELLRLALSGGGSVLRAVEVVGRHRLGPVSVELATVGPAIARGRRLGEALEQSLERLGGQVRPLIRTLLGSEHYGTEITTTLRRLAGEARDDRRRRAQAEARRIPVRLLLPLVLGILPAFVLLTVVPVLAGTFDGLGPGPAP